VTDCAIFEVPIMRDFPTIISWYQCKSRLLRDSCSSVQSFASGFLPTPPHDDAVASGSELAPLLLPPGDFHPQLIALPGALKTHTPLVWRRLCTAMPEFGDELMTPQQAYETPVTQFRKSTLASGDRPVE
jgi:hypothetical protein